MIEHPGVSAASIRFNLTILEFKESIVIRRYTSSACFNLTILEFKDTSLEFYLLSLTRFNLTILEFKGGYCYLNT